MPSRTNKVTVGSVERLKFFEQLDAPGIAGGDVRFGGIVTVQLAGTATSIVAVVERASQDPGSGNEDWAPAEPDPFTGNLVDGVHPRMYREPSDGWWRVRVIALEGGYVRVSMAGDDV